MAKKKVVKFKKESVKERLQKDENAWFKLGEALNFQLADISKYWIRLEERVVVLEKEVAELKNKRGCSEV